VNGTSRLSDLLLDLREAQDAEIKGWLDLRGNEEHKATLAKALLALANHGGGFVVIGFTETDTGAIPEVNGLHYRYNRAAA
jgi:predicted HTH transcriptional regulator